MKVLQFCIVIIFIGFISSCFPPVEESAKTLDYKLEDETVQKILQYQDERKTDSLLSYFISTEPKYKLLASKAFASIKDSNAIPGLISLLSDENEIVRASAAFSLGQIGSSKAEAALIKAFIAVDSIGPYLNTNAKILEAIGKCGTDSSLVLISNIKSYSAKDTLLVRAQMSAFFHFAKRDKFNVNSLEQVFRILENPNYDPEAKLIAAHYLMRFKELNISNYFDRLKKLCVEEKNSEIRMALVGALSKIPNPQTLVTLDELYSRGLDIRVLSNLFKGLNQSFKTGQANSFALRAVQNPSMHVAIPAANYLLDNASVDIIEELKTLADQGSLPWQVKSIVYASLLKKIPHYMVLTRDGYVYRLKDLIGKSKSTYEKAAYIKALSEIPKELPYIVGLYSDQANSFENITIAEAIKKNVERQDFALTFPGKFNPIYNQLTKYFTDNVLRGDQGVMAIMSELFLKDRQLVEKYVRPDSLLKMGKEKLNLPRDIETWNAVEKLLVERYQKGKFYPKKIEYNHPVDWKKVAILKDSIFIKINTDKGEINAVLITKNAATTVMNFVQLIKEDFFKGKIFHRVVPNFVVQAGCPRGDGYGSLDYTIRTEISELNFLATGMLGMASAGNDTESCQFFITHSPTPHLDGNYTVFGKVIGGLEVLLTLSQGDKIIDIKLL
jgi:cyclophilin family peptidyl-prolyl cis-trans isomerase/HEAT repeat protein